MLDLLFRFVTKDDISELQSLYKECFPVTLFSYPDSWFQDLITNPALMSYIAISNDRIVGVLVAKIVSLEDCSPGDRKILDTCFPLHSNVAYILSLGVTETYRSQGIASHLLSAFINYASGAYYTQKHGNHKSVLPAPPSSYPYNTVSITDSFYAAAVTSSIKFSPADRPSHHNRTFRSPLDLVELFPPYPPVCYAIYLHVLRTNHAARQFYEHRGFRLVRIQRGCYTIAGMPADGCTYVLHVNGGFTDEFTLETAVATTVAEPFRLYPSSNASCMTTASQTLSQITFWFPYSFTWIFQMLVWLIQIVLCKLSTSLAHAESSPPSSPTSPG
ncbi:hypothetical protein PHET_03689 [Paragonimus heterotremus]|uniref:N-alpha-acetyltransferase 60 n=1 Tax=Paragonimus heterotremus TaxID=100268 RepID=A0A8J4TDH4_9TREM|nr:hypothetical protein PHET_03689 [Paragonimus heterotremus]